MIVGDEDSLRLSEGKICLLYTSRWAWHVRWTMEILGYPNLQTKEVVMTEICEKERDVYKRQAWR